MKIYSLDGNIIDTDSETLIEYLFGTIIYGDGENNCDIRNTYMTENEFVVYEGDYGMFRIIANSGHYGHGSCVQVSDCCYFTKADNGYLNLMDLGPKMSVLMEIKELTHEEILANMHKLREFIIILVDNIRDCCYNYGGSTTKSAANS